MKRLFFRKTARALRERRSIVWPLVSGAVLFALLFFLPIEGAYRLPCGIVVQGWLCRGVRLAFPLIFAALLAFSAWIWTRTGGRLSGVEPGTESVDAVLQALRPFAWLPALAAFRHTAGWFGAPVAAMALPLGVPFLFALASERISRAAFERTGEGARPEGRVRAATVFAVAFAALLALHVWPAGRRFDGGGDVRHYETQVRSLVEDGTLDLTERVEGWMDEARVPPARRDAYLLRSHMRRNANGRIYSVHAYGWPLLAWPFAKVAGDAGESLLCVLIGALALAGVFASCRRCGASESSSLWATAMLGLSWFWVYTSLSRLPEMLGCALCIWGFWAVLAQREPGGAIRATAVSAACCAGLPLAHMRLFPIAAVLVLAFLAAGAVPPRGGGDRRRGVRLALHAAAVLLAWAALWRVHAAMFAGGGSFRMSRIFFSHPVAMLGIFTDRRGAGGVFPLIWLLAPAPAAFLAVGPRPRRAAAALALALEATTLVACCANHGALVGMCVSARYFLQAIPPLVPFGALWLDRAGRSGRRWWLFLAWIPVLYLFAVSPWCSKTGLVLSPYGLWEIDAFRSFFQPFRLTFEALSPSRAALCLVLPLCIVAASFPVAFRTPSRAAVAAFWALLAVGGAAGLAADRFLPRARFSPSWAFGSEYHWREFRRIAGPAPRTFFDAFLADEARNPGESALVVSADPAPNAPSRDRIVRADSIPRNDWAGRDLHWTSVRTLRSVGRRRGGAAVRVRGRMENGGALLSAASPRRSFFPDGVPVGPGAFDVVLLVPTSPSPTTVFAALADGAGTLRVETVDVLPWTPGLDRGVGPFPGGTIVADGFGAGGPLGTDARPDGDARRSTGAKDDELLHRVGEQEEQEVDGDLH